MPFDLLAEPDDTTAASTGVDTLWLDTETYNTRPLSKEGGVGGYRYAETAELMIASYAMDDGVVRVWDATAGIVYWLVTTPTGKNILREDRADAFEMPSELRAALLDDQVKIVAHNASFDRQIVEQAIGLTPRLERWRCTMVQAYSHAYPGSLDMLGKLLGLPADKAKMDAGKKLINRFCKPAPANHKVRRYDRHTHPEEWAQFLLYAAIDIVAMREVAARLPTWNWKQSDIDLWHLDQRINDRGMAIDRDLVIAGAKAAVAEKAALEAEFIELVEQYEPHDDWLVDGDWQLVFDENDNPVPHPLVAPTAPTQRERFRRYLNQRFAIKLDNTRKDTLQPLIDGGQLDPAASRLMEIALLGNKTSTAKYKALLPMIQDDDRFRGGLQFRGAARTRRFCLTGDHEVLTKNGWVRLDEWHGGVIAQWKPANGGPRSRNSTVRFAHADRVMFDYEGSLLHAQRKHRIDVAMTPEHTVPHCTGASAAGHLYGKEVTGVPRSGVWNVPRGARHTPHRQTRILVMLQHDGWDSGARIEWSFAKERKMRRCRFLLTHEKIPFKLARRSNGVWRFTVRKSDRPVWLRKRDFGPWLIQEGHDPATFIDEIQHWDGGNRRHKQIEVCCRDRINAEWTCTMAHLAGCAGTLTKRKNGYWFANISKTGNCVQIKKSDWAKKTFRGRVYCAITRSGFFLVRRNGVVSVTGNSGRGFQPQNLPSRGLPDQRDTDQYISALKDGCHDMLFGDLMLYGAAALRSVVVAPGGKLLNIADLSNIEGRLAAWLADETWKLDAFRDFDAGTGPDLYMLTASAIIGVDPLDVDALVPGKTDKIRNVFGKVPDLFGAYQGGYGAAQTFAKSGGLLTPDGRAMSNYADTIFANVDPTLITAAKRNHTLFGAKNNPEADYDEWIACEVVKLAWRARHPATVRLWALLQDAAMQAIENPGKSYKAGRWLTFAMRVHAGVPYLLCKLPSRNPGDNQHNYLCYREPRVHRTASVTEDGYERVDKTITYMGIKSGEAGGVFGAWTRIHAYGGKWLENMCQSIAYDVMMHNAPAIEAAGFDIIISVHDELPTEADGDRADELAALMATVPPWATGLPLAATGFSTQAYRKD